MKGQDLRPPAGPGAEAVSTRGLVFSAEEVGRMLQIERRSFSHPWTSADFARVAADTRSLSLGLWRSRVLVGYAIGYADGEECHLASLAVDVPYRRAGGGSRLLAGILEQASRRRCRWCGLEVRSSNTAAMQLYRKFGFHVVGVEPRFYARPTEDAWLMGRPLLAEGGPNHRADQIGTRAPTTAPRRRQWPKSF